MIEAYVDDAFTGLSNGDAAVWNSAAYSARAVTIGTDGFATISAAITAVASGGTVWIADTTVDAPSTITKSVVIRGRNAVIEQLDPIVVNGVSVRFRDVAFTVSTGTPACQVRTTNSGLAGFMHCTFNGAATAAVESSGVGAAVVLCGCSWSNITSDAPAVAKNGAAFGVFARTTMPVGGSVGRAGNFCRHKMRIDAPAEYRDLSKSQKQIFVPVDTVFGSIEPVRGHEYTQARLAGVDATHRICIPGGVTVTSAFRAVIRERTYHFGAVLTTDTRENYVSFLALERVA